MAKCHHCGSASVGLTRRPDRGERKRLRAKIDAAAFHAYSLDREETQFVLIDFHRVRSPQLMTVDYFERVLDEYDTLAEVAPPA